MARQERTSACCEKMNTILQHLSIQDLGPLFVLRIYEAISERFYSFLKIIYCDMPSI